MDHNLYLYNTLSRTKEKFEPIHPNLVGMYVCGPTVYSDVHLGNCRTFVSFDLIFRYLRHLGYKVRYVRNITDAGHLEGDRDEGDDKFAKKAKLEQLEPMEIVQKYTIGFHDVLRLFNTLPPSIEPTATGHISEQIEMIEQIIENGYAYERNGTVYFDVEKYVETYDYTILTNRKLEDMLNNTRELSGQDEKKGRLDFALWIKAKPETIMRWPAPWSVGFPGWHIECSAMSRKYLGDQFDIHGGGMDLAATHHTNEIAQSEACNHTSPAKYWMHTNMLTVNGARMSKSAGNGFLPGELFTGNHPLLNRGYSPMAVRFFMLQAHYRSTLDFSNEALDAADKGYKRLMTAISLLDKLKVSKGADSFNLAEIRRKCYAAMDDDFNSPVLIAELFEIVRIINSIYDGKAKVTAEGLEGLKLFMKEFVEDILGLRNDQTSASDDIDDVMNLVIKLRNEAKANKDFVTSDRIRDELNSIGIQLKDSKEGTLWNKI
ncbi:MULTISPECIES: cysteine--tRNA ligase [Sphingobacterium]|jgi:cysteinyl-tRNA synthetase|uniref:Cysteine--tRNA ligase n=2 Tax=Sphingobacterium TaxID=28453 RepID=A0A2X2J430_SPHMU|nr:MULTISPECIES: cysteine--tRNA ligase [Sphingobacterium]HAK30848.1 cysteine--tRNA ligase [Sphingobacterium sp.]MDF2853092.1 cysteine--tRNA ligase [Sphingobacterium multivorum]QQT42892.1 cysteine--tRNA ligase [Sphingobacterium multivorum]QRQ60544.1 cysteine--tRNA ligase [Sphingobacterium multivorum]SPZ87101.1 Cysteine--tRNA ligase [Sphingobacterium multivorum]